VNQQKIGTNQFKPASRERQEYANNGQPNGQVSQSQRAQSTGNRKNQTVQNVNLSQSQRLNMSQYNQQLQMKMSHQKQPNYDPNSTGNNQNVSQILKQRIKDFQDMIKITSADGTTPQQQASKKNVASK
jgi:hypothetical protein